jgi:5-methylcytosine-specific restriction endonuclease McrA
MQDCTVKSCSKCKLSKPLSEFVKDSTQADGRTRWCKSCKSAKYFEHAEHNKSRQRAFFRANRQAHYDTMLRWKAKNTDRYLAIRRKAGRKFDAHNPHAAIARAQTRLARLAALPATLTPEQWVETLEFFNYRCAYCGTDSGNLHQEHMIPLSRGGGYTKGNIVPACAVCNGRKGTKTAEEFLGRPLSLQVA